MIQRTSNCFALSLFYLPILLFPPLQELNASFEEWEKLMRASNLDSAESDFVQVMGLITRMFKQTAIAKVIFLQHVT